MPTAFVTGANGFLGLNIVELLCAERWSVVGLYQPGTSRTYLDRFAVDLVESDITDAERLESVAPRNVDVVFHTAAMTSIWSRNNDLQARVNIDGTRNVARTALMTGAKRLIHTSTWNTYGTGRTEITEETPQEGHRSWVSYVKTKAIGEQEARKVSEDGLPTVILNPGHLVGRYDTRNWGRMIRMVHDQTLPGVPSGKSCFCHAEAVARAHIAATRDGRPGEIYLLPGVEASLREVIEIIGELTHKPVPAKDLPTWLLKVVAHMKVWRAALTGHEPDLTPEGVELMFNDPRIVSDKAQRELGYEPGDLRTMVEDAHNWMKREGLLT